VIDPRVPNVWEDLYESKGGKYLFGRLRGQAITYADLTVQRELQGASVGMSTLAGLLTALRSLKAVAQGAARMVGRFDIPLLGPLEGRAIATAELRVTKTLRSYVIAYAQVIDSSLTTPEPEPSGARYFVQKYFNKLFGKYFP
jgi:hypothetical protein